MSFIHLPNAELGAPNAQLGTRNSERGTRNAGPLAGGFADWISRAERGTRNADAAVRGHARQRLEFARKSGEDSGAAERENDAASETDLASASFRGLTPGEIALQSRACAHLKPAVDGTGAVSPAPPAIECCGGSHAGQTANGDRGAGFPESAETPEVGVTGESEGDLGITLSPPSPTPTATAAKLSTASPGWEVKEAGGQKSEIGNLKSEIQGPPPASEPGALPTAVMPPLEAEAAAEALSDLPEESATAADGPVEISSAGAAEQAAVVAKPDGTSAAKHNALMKKGIRQNEFSQLGEQNLPVASAETDGGSSLTPVSRPARLAGSPDWNPNLLVSSATENHRVEIEHASGVVPAAPASAPDLARERTQEMVAAHALRLKHSTDGSLQVVIKPADGLQISLDLRRVAAGVEVRAELQQGDFNFLSRHWAELQQQLESRGIRLAPLTGDPAAGGGAPGPESGSQNAASRRQPSEIRNPKSEIRIPNSDRRPPASAPAGHWELWA